MAKGTEEIIDLETLETVENTPEEEEKLEEETSEEEEQEEEESSEEEESEEDADDEDDKEEQEEEEEEEEEEEGEPEEEEEEEEEQEEPDVDKIISDSLGEKYDIKDLSTLTEILDGYADIEKEFDEFKEKSKEPQFKTEKHKKAYEFISQFDIDQIQEGGSAYSRLIGMNPEKMDDKDALREQFILENKDLSREEASVLFDDEFNQQFVVTRKKDDEGEEEDEESFGKRKKLASIRQKRAVGEAKKYLQSEIDKLKVEDGDDPAKPDKKEVSEVVTKGIGETIDSFKSEVKGSNSVKFKIANREDSDAFTFTLPKDAEKLLVEAGSGILQDPNLYDDKGKINSNVNLPDLKNRLIWANFGDKILEEAVKHGINLGATDQVEEAEGQKPKRKGRKGSSKVELTPEEQWDKLAEEADKKRS